MGLPVNRRHFLTTAAVTAGTVALPPAVFPARAAAAVPPQVTLPQRGIYDTRPATHWSDGFLTGNGEYGALFHGAPALEKVVFNHHRFVMPNGTRGLTPPVYSGVLGRVRDKALAGDYAGATRDFTAGWSLRNTQTFHPGYELQISTPGVTTTNNYARITDFTTGEVTSTWTDGSGTWTRRGFASRADQVIVHELAPAPGRTVDATLSVNAALDGVPGSVGFATLATVTGADGYLNLRGTYPSGQGAFGYEGVTRVVATGGSVRASGATIVVSGATRLVLLTKLDRYESSTTWNAKPLHTALAALPADYLALRVRHVALHGPQYERSRLDLNVSAADRQLSTSELIGRQNAARDVVDVALLERMYDSGRYLFLSSSGVLPPRLTGLWSGAWNAAWAGDFTTDANVNFQVAGGNILSLTEAMRGYFNLILGQLDDWRLNARNLYGARGLHAPSRTDGEHGRMLHLDYGFPGHTWTGGADWLLYPLLEYYQVTGDTAFYRDSVAPVLMELALFYEDFLTRTDSGGKVVFVPCFSVENAPGNTGRQLSINATGEIAAGRHALQAAVDAANTLGVEQGQGQGVQRWTALLARLPAYRVNSDGALAEWAWPSLTDNYDHRHAQHMYGAFPLHEINPEDRPDLIGPARRALDVRGDENLSAHGAIHRCFARARLKDGPGFYANLRKILGNNMVFRSLMTSHNPGLDIYNADAANALPAMLAEALVYTRPGVLELLPALPDQLGKGTITGVRGRNRIAIDALSWDIPAGTVTATVTSGTAQSVTLICRRGIGSITTTAPVSASPLGDHARIVSLAGGVRTDITVRLAPPTGASTVRLVNRRSGKVLDVNGGSTADGAAVIQWAWTGAANQQWRTTQNADGSVRLTGVGSGKALTSPNSTQGTALVQAADTGGAGQRWKLVAAATSGYHRVVNAGNGLCLDVEGGSTADGARVIQWPANGGTNQEWQIITL
ncbi:lectin [Sphaerisporangium rufum]|uniref:Lectin n=1 Tax=Sphaerisporangium rufum TaxID=1381558 RepID=A0A919RDH6_9ACTN|nr:glycoside hydrolase N-terminal domain-containing protein [Sphaerisporangium rufum]GII81995.1 lectin [Sphaerisporangium rufum]